MSDRDAASKDTATAADHAEERAELQRVLDSGAFDRSPILSRLLVHVCERYFLGFEGQLKESTIAVEVFRRPADFDSRQDPIVRVNANRLREALTRFYGKGGRRHPLQITIPPGQYVPVFRSAGNGAAAPQPAPQPPRRSRRALALAALGGLALGLLPWAVQVGRGRAGGERGPALLPVPFVDSSVRILAGSSVDATDALGQSWVRDAYFSGGLAVRLADTAASGLAPVYRSFRKGRFSYDVPLASGCYELRLHFIEAERGNSTQGGETSRLFHVELNGSRVLRSFDVIADAGGSRTPDVKVLTDVSPAADGRLHLSFRGEVQDAILSGIEILPGIPGRMRPLRLTAQDRPFVSADGLLWSPDHDVRGGQTVVRSQPVRGTAPDPGLFRAERFGNFRYTIPAAPGSYTLRLFFAETFFGAANGRSAEAPRLFDVFCNGRTLLHGLDVMGEAGGENRALVKTFPGLTPNAQGKLILDFVPIRNLATLSALELVAD
jgi:hypothetical protein